MAPILGGVLFALFVWGTLIGVGHVLRRVYGESEFVMRAKEALQEDPRVRFVSRVNTALMSFIAALSSLASGREALRLHPEQPIVVLAIWIVFLMIWGFAIWLLSPVSVLIIAWFHRSSRRGK